MGKQSSSAKKKQDNFTEDSYVHGDEYTNAANIISNRHDINFDGVEALSDDDNNNDDDGDDDI